MPFKRENKSKSIINKFYSKLNKWTYQSMVREQPLSRFITSQVDKAALASLMTMALEVRTTDLDNLTSQISNKTQLSSNSKRRLNKKNQPNKLHNKMLSPL